MVERVLVDVVVVGGGQGGLGVAYHLVRSGADVVVLERGRVGQTWRSQRWDSFRLNTPNWMNGLPGAEYTGPDPFGFMTHLELADSFEEYVERFHLPVHTGVAVTGVSPAHDHGRYLVTGETSDGQTVSYVADSVVVASGILQSPRTPAISSKIPGNIVQLHTGTYRSPGLLPAGAVVVIGGGQSGGQIVEDLLNAGRVVYFSISSAPRVPRSHRGRDFMDWWVEMGIWDVQTNDVDDPEVLKATNPLVSGVGPRGHSVSYQQLARDGARLMGRLQEVVGGVLITDDRVMEYIRNADGRSKEMGDKIDAYITRTSPETAAAVIDPADVPVPPDTNVDFLTTLNLEEANVGAIVWATGFAADFSWIDLPVTDDNGKPLHRNGICDVPGIYFIGFPWLSKRKSGVILGVDEDARRITDAILNEAKIA